MPNPSHSGILISPWHHCDVCGFDYRCNQLRRQDGLLKCSKCFDNPIATLTNEGRKKRIDKVLSDGKIEADIDDILKNDDDIEIDEWTA